MSHGKSQIQLQVCLCCLVPVTQAAWQSQVFQTGPGQPGQQAEELRRIAVGPDVCCRFVWRASLRGSDAGRSGGGPSGPEQLFEEEEERVQQGAA